MSSHRTLCFNIQRFSIHDGPGIRTTVFFKGCPLSCLWCSNPEGIAPNPQIIVRQNRCIGCGKCVEACPENAIELKCDNDPGNMLVVKWDRCNQCLECAKQCPTEAISVVGRAMTLKEVLEQSLADRAFFQNSGGGVTASGGEPLYQWRFVRDLFEQLKARGIHTVLDTCGYTQWEALEEVLPYTDVVLYDLKHMDTGIHRKLTGKDNSLILANAERTARRVETWFRVPLIPGYNDSEQNIKQVAEFALYCQVTRISLLVFHEYGRHKYGQIGRQYLMQVEKPRDDEWLKNICKLIEKHNLTVVVNR